PPLVPTARDVVASGTTPRCAWTAPYVSGHRVFTLSCGARLGHQRLVSRAVRAASARLMAHFLPRGSGSTRGSTLCRIPRRARLGHGRDAVLRCGSQSSSLLDHADSVADDGGIDHSAEKALCSGSDCQWLPVDPVCFGLHCKEATVTAGSEFADRWAEQAAA